MLEIRCAKEVRGKVHLPPNPDVYALVLALCAATGRRAVIAPVPRCPQRLRWDETFAPLLHIEENEERVMVEPVTDKGALIQNFALRESPHGEFMLFMLLGMGITVTIAREGEGRIARWMELMCSVGCSLDVQTLDDSLSLRVTLSRACFSPLPACDPDSFEALLGLAFGAGSECTGIQESSYVSPLRPLLVLLGARFSTRNLSGERRGDPIARRIQRMRTGGKKSGTTPQLFEIRLAPPAHAADEAVFISLPGDTTLCSVLICAKSLIQRGNLVIENAPLDAWALPPLGFIRKMGCTPAVQPRDPSSCGEQGLLQLQRFEPVGRKCECTPLYLYRSHVASLCIISLFAKGESVLRELELLRQETPDEIEVLAACLRDTGAHLGEMPDGIIIKGGRQIDGFDLASAYAPALAGAFCAAGLKSTGSTTVNDIRLLQRWPDFAALLDSICVYRSSS